MDYDNWHEQPPDDDDAIWPADLGPSPNATDYGTRPLVGDWLAGIGLVALILAVAFLFFVGTP